MSHHSVTPNPRTTAQTIADTALSGVVRRAREAQKLWETTDPAHRSRVLLRFRDALFSRRSQIADLVTRESGKPITDALGIDILLTLNSAAWTARNTPRFLLSHSKRPSGSLFWRKKIRTHPKPLGVIAVIAPWNYPLFMPASGTIPALACGNAVILKPSEFTPKSAGVLNDLFTEAGLPDGVFQIVQGDGKVGAELVESGVDKVVFTGSTETGRKIAVACARQLIPCSLELGGSDAAIVLKDANVEHAADGIAWTRFANAGQTCVAVKRVFVEAPAYEPFVKALTRSVAAVKSGPPLAATTEVGNVIHAQAAELLSAQLDDALAKGARIATTADSDNRDTQSTQTGASRNQLSSPNSLSDRWFPPTVLVDVNQSMRVMREETFGPILPVVKVDSADDAIRQANSSQFGLSASIWTRNRKLAQKLAQRLESGSAMINDASSVVGIPDVPYGGAKSSGIGRMHGEAGLQEFVRHQTIVDDRFSAWRQPWWFPYGESHLNGLDAFARFVHAPNIGARISAIPGVVRLLMTRKGTHNR